MNKSVKKIVHDLAPLATSCTELSKILSQLLCGIESHTTFDNSTAKKYFEECTKAAEKMAISTKLIEEYIQDLRR